jgi:ribonuclease P protein subunit RPR2
MAMKMEKEKKLKGSQKIALERIHRLLELAPKNEKYSKRYVSIAKEISKKIRVQIPKELKEQYCKKCCSIKVKTFTTGPFLIVKCEECGFEKKYGIKNKPKTKKGLAAKGK